MFGRRSDMIVVIFVQSQISDLTFDERIEIFYLRMVLKLKVNVFEAFVKRLCHNLYVIWFGDELMPKAYSKNF